MKICQRASNHCLPTTPSDWKVLKIAPSNSWNRATVTCSTFTVIDLNLNNLSYTAHGERLMLAHCCILAAVTGCNCWRARTMPTSPWRMYSRADLSVLQRPYNKMSARGKPCRASSDAPERLNVCVVRDKSSHPKRKAKRFTQRKADE